MIRETSTQDERRLLISLAKMCDQYLSEGEYLDHHSMSAGEHAVELLAQYGLITPGPRGGTWTEAGRTILNRDSKQ